MDKGKKESFTFFFVVLFTRNLMARPLRIKLSIPSPEKRDIYEYFFRHGSNKKEAFNHRLVFK